MSKFDELKKLAEAATPGKWTKRTHARMPSFVQAPRASKDDPYDIEILGEDECLYSTREADVSFIVAAQPAAILELLAIQAQLVEALAGYKLLYEEVQPAGGWQGVYEIGNYALAAAGE